MTGIVNSLENLLSSIVGVFRSFFEGIFAIIQTFFTSIFTFVKSIGEMVGGLLGFVLSNIVILGLLAGGYYAYLYINQRQRGGQIQTPLTRNRGKKAI